MGKKVIQGKGLIYRGFLKQGDAQNLQYCVEIQGEIEPFAEDGHEQVAADGDPDLGFDGVLRGAVKGFDAQVLLDPFEEQFDMPATTVQFGDDVRRKSEVISEEHQSLFPLGIPITNATKLSWIAFSGVEPLQRDGLIALHARAFVNGMRDATQKAEVFPRTSDEESAMQGPAIQSFEVEVTAIHDIEGARLRSELVQHIDIVNARRSNANKRWNLATQVEQRVQFQSVLRGTEVGPGKQCHAQVDGSGVEGIDGVGQVEPQVFVAVQPSRFCDQRLCEITVDTPVAGLIGIGQRAARNLAADAEMVELVLLGAQAGDDVAQTFAVAQLSEHHRKKMVPARKASHPIVAGVAFDAAPKLMSRQVIDQLRKEALSVVHRAAIVTAESRERAL